MIKEVIKAVWKATGAMARRPMALLLALFLYLGLIGAVWLFVTTREATLTQLAVTVMTALVAASLFFAMQSIAVRYTSSDAGFGGALRGASRDCLKLFAISLPILVVAVVGLFVFALLEFLIMRGRPEAQYGFLYTRFIPGLRFSLLLVALPLVAVQLWIAVTRDGLRLALKGMGMSVARAFSPKSLLTYLLILVVFGTIAYLLIFTRTPASNAWLEIGLLVGRLALAGLVIFLGWFLGVGALTEATEENREAL